MHEDLLCQSSSWEQLFHSFQVLSALNRKNSSEKTMNGNFLKRVFASETFANDYRDFLHELEALMAEDNEKKIIYLAEVL